MTPPLGRRTAEALDFFRRLSGCMFRPCALRTWLQGLQVSAPLTCVGWMYVQALTLFHRRTPAGTQRRPGGDKGNC